MPELAEVEFYRKQWDKGIGHTVQAVHLHAQTRVFRGTDARLLNQALPGSSLLRSAAHGKQMLFRFSKDLWLGLHLGMTGKLRAEKSQWRPAKHDHLVLWQKGRSLVFSDMRQFGRVLFHQGPTVPKWWTRLSPAVTSKEFTVRLVREFLKRHSRLPVKAVLLLQSGFPGIGNWMADETLWRSGINPHQRAGNLREDSVARLWRETRHVARHSVRTIGHGFDEPPKNWLIHERWTRNGRCPRDGTRLRRETIAGRTAAWCPKCQPPA